VIELPPLSEPAAPCATLQDAARPARALVWFKRDLRVADHAPLQAAQAADVAAALFVIEPAWRDSPECEAQHLGFALACLAPLRAALAERGLPLLVRVGEMPAVLATLHAESAFTHLLSHEETGPLWSYARDKAVAAWCRQHGVRWQEWPQTGVVRRLRSRLGWAGRWQARMDAAQVASEHGAYRGARLPLADLPTLADLGVHAAPRPLPPAGETAAQAVLHDFLHRRGGSYRRALSSPLTAETGCSRLSAHLAFGTVSMRQVHQATEARIAAARADARVGAAGEAAWAQALRGFAGRLRWHCHFMQKLEDEPAIEQRNFARIVDGLRPGDGTDWDDEAERRFQAWCAGRTGFPMVDACMRQLRATGWLNFRMRAMLVSFAAYHLWLHWRRPGLFLARQFLDFEPGIHWSQMQMQSGTTGINTLRIYSPAKQARDHDPEGIYQRRWLPELGTADYPAPVVEERTALRHAKDTLYALRSSAAARAEADAVQARHGSRKSGLPPSGGPGRARAGGARRARKPAGPAAADAAQAELF
jgi:deoxyribodipyrimidine photo-lyase